MDLRIIRYTTYTLIATTARYVWRDCCVHRELINTVQYFTWADRVGGSYKQPESSLDPLLEVEPVAKSQKGSKAE